MSNDDRYAYFGKNKKSFDNFETQKVLIDSDKIQVDDDVLEKYSSDTTITDLIESVYRDNDEDMTVKIVTKIWNSQIKEEYKTPHPYFPLTRGLVKNQDEVRQVLNDMKSRKWGNGIFADMLEMRIIKEAKHTVATPESVITGMIKIFFDF